MAIASGSAVAVANGTVTLTDSGRLRFTPAADYNGSTRFGYTVTSGGVAESATVNVTVRAVNDAPVPAAPPSTPPGQTFDPVTGNYAATTAEDTAFSGQVAVQDADGDAPTYTVTAAPAHGTVALDAASGAYTYTPTPDFHGADSFQVTASDGQGGSSTSTVRMTVTPVADITNDAGSTDEDAPVDIEALGNDSFESTERAITHVDGQAIASGGSIAVAQGTVTLLANESLRFTPAADFNGPTSFSYTVSAGGVSEAASVDLTVRPLNDAPAPSAPSTPTSGQTFDPATGDYAAHTAEDTAFNGAVAARDVDGDTLSYSVTAAPSHGAVTLDAATGAYTYTPTADWHGADSFEVTVSDGKGGSATSTVHMTVTPVHDIANDSTQTREDEAVTIAVLGNDSFENADHAITAIDGQSVTVGTPVAVANGMVTLLANGSLRFAPAADFHGPTNFSYTVASGGVSETATVHVDVKPVNDAPVPVAPSPSPGGLTFDPVSGDFAGSTAEDTAFSGRAAAQDIDGDALTYSLARLPQHGSVTLDAATGDYVYTPVADWHGDDSFEVMASDGQGGSNTSTVRMTVTPVADIANDVATTNEDKPIDIDVLGNDSFEDAEHAITAIDGTAIASGGSVAVANGTVTLNANGSLRFAPTAEFHGTQNFSYTVTAGGVSETANVRVDVTPVNDRPELVEPKVPGQTFEPASGDHVAGTDEDAPFSGRISARDADGDSLTYRIASAPSHGAVAIDAATGAYTYTPAADWHGDDSFEVAVSDSQGGTTTTTVRMPVRPVADIADDSVAVNEDEALVIEPLANDSFERSDRTITMINAAPVTVGVPVELENGELTLRADGTLAFMPGPNFNGPVQFSYTVDAGGITETAMVNVNVRPVNDAPILLRRQGETGGDSSETWHIDEDEEFFDYVRARDADNDTLSYAVHTPPQHGSVRVDSEGEYTYTPTGDWHGTDNFSLTISDGQGGATVLDVTMVLAPVGV
jgi:hypothetical protein